MLLQREKPMLGLRWRRDPGKKMTPGSPSRNIANTRVKRIMVNTRGSINILYFDAFHKLGLTDNDLVPMTSSLTGFIGDSISPLGTTTLQVTIEEKPMAKTLMEYERQRVKRPTRVQIVLLDRDNLA
ncbi:hypothetical protein GW17_00041752 [Ensete ventricosum]|nr:hypothetical protein GW17_00041752 [Ensete ventricosum]